MKPTECPEYNTCMKIDSLCDRDMPHSQFVDGVYKTCGDCKEKSTMKSPYAYTYELECAVQRRVEAQAKWQEARFDYIEAFIKRAFPELDSMTEEQIAMFAELYWSGVGR